MAESDKLHEECGVFGIYAPAGVEAARDLYDGLTALQHRGQESAGISVSDTFGEKGNIVTKKGMGLVSEVFGKADFMELKGNIGVGHVRYSTTGESSLKNAQPIAMNYLKGCLALVHNGNIVNAGEIKEEQMRRGMAHYTTTDSEVLAYEIIQERVRSASIEEAIIKAAGKLKGGYAVIVMSPRKLVGIRDPFGIKPLVIGKKGEVYLLASESAAINSVGGEVIRDVKPGEIISITNFVANKNSFSKSEEGVRLETDLRYDSDLNPESVHNSESDINLEPDLSACSGIKVVSNESLCGGREAHCIFEYIYFARNDSVMDGIEVHEARMKAGMALARASAVEADLVAGVPDSGLAAAEGYALESGIPFALAFHKNSYIGRSFIKPTDEERKTAVHMKLSVLKHVVEGKRIVLIDDSIVRGTTMRQIVEMLRQAGAVTVHVRISSPPFLYPCYYGTDVPNKNQLIASEHSEAEICKSIGADSLKYLHIEDFKTMVGELPLCSACFDGRYPVLG